MMVHHKTKVNQNKSKSKSKSEPKIIDEMDVLDVLDEFIHPLIHLLEL